MKLSSYAKIGIGAMALSVAAAASAQTNGPTGISARLGLFLPTSSDIGGAFFAAGLDYKLNSLSSIPGPGTVGYFGLSADYYTQAGASNLPVVINYNLRAGQMVYSAGAGIDFYDVPQISGSGTGLDLQLGATYEFTRTPTPLFLQAKYFFASRDELRGFGLYAGIRF